MTNQTYYQHQEVIDNYKVQGYLLKAVSDDIQAHLAGVLEGVVCETMEDGTAQVFLIDDSEDDKTRLKPFLVYKEGEFTEMKGRKFLVTPVIPPEKSKGLFVSKSGRVMIPLMC